MESLIKADIFFFVTTIAVALVAVLFITVLVYALRILRDLKDISSTVRVETKATAEDFRELRANIKTQGLSIRPLWNFFGRLKNRKKGRSKE